jgi:hypothetical protein
MNAILPTLPAPGGKLIDGPVIPVRIAILVISDTRDEETDTTGPLLAARVQEAGFVVAARRRARSTPSSPRGAPVSRGAM